MKYLIIALAVVILGGCANRPDSTEDGKPEVKWGDRATITLSGVQELDVELVSFRATNKRRRSYVFTFQKLSAPEQFSIEVWHEGFAKEFIETHPAFMKEYGEGRQALIQKTNERDYTKEINPFLRYRIKIDAKPSISRILEWKPIE